jgi:PAS domain S-box-containing protein
LKKREIWAVFVNLSLPDSQGLATLGKLLLAVPKIPTLILAGAKDIAVALEALRHGAKDYRLENHLDSNSFVLAIRNMAERQTAREILSAETERAQMTQNSIGDAVLSIDLEHRITYLNAVAERTGSTREEAAGKEVEDVFAIIDGSTRKPWLHPLKTALEQNKTVGLTPHCILIRRDGAEFAVEDSAAPIHYLGLEVTESVLMQHAEFTVPVLKKLKAMGIRLAIDDFGTGYSSLSYLRQFPSDTLKVDQSFVQGINADTDDATIINAVINMGSNLKYRVIAEGVETVEQVAFLQAHGCDEGQGYYFSRPVPASQFVKLLEAGTTIGPPN